MSADYAGWYAGAIFDAQRNAKRNGAGELSGGAGRDPDAYHGTTPPVVSEIRGPRHGQAAPAVTVTKG